MYKLHKQNKDLPNFISGSGKKIRDIVMCIHFTTLCKMIWLSCKATHTMCHFKSILKYIVLFYIILFSNILLFFHTYKDKCHPTMKLQCWLWHVLSSYGLFDIYPIFELCLCFFCLSFTIQAYQVWIILIHSMTEGKKISFMAWDVIDKILFNLTQCYDFEKTSLKFMKLLRVSLRTVASKVLTPC